jgi:hypothetical protein
MGVIDRNPTAARIRNTRTAARREQRPFESWEQVDAISAEMDPRFRSDSGRARRHRPPPRGTESASEIDANARGLPAVRLRDQVPPPPEGLAQRTSKRSWPERVTRRLLVLDAVVLGRCSECVETPVGYESRGRGPSGTTPTSPRCRRWVSRPCPDTLRNHFEHLDERIEESEEAGVYVGDSVMPSGSFYHPKSMPDRANAQLRNFDPFTGRLSVWEDELDIDALAAELVSIGRAAGPVYGPSTDAPEPP